MKNSQNKPVRYERNLNRPTIITTPAPPLEIEEVARMHKPLAGSNIPQQEANNNKGFPNQRSYEYVIEEEISYKAKRRLIYTEKFPDDRM